jgi:D-glucosaminate-6-phosphate ammonia-lyase
MPSPRRSFLQHATAFGAFAPAAAAAAAKTAPPRDFLKELGVRPLINAAGSYTMFTGSLMNPECVKAIEAMSHRFVRIVELHDAVGKRIAQMLNVEAAMVPSGAAAGLTLGTAAVLTQGNPDFIARIPDLTGMKSEVLIQKTHRFPYDHMVRNCGVKLIEIETREELERAINPRTAMLLFLNKADHLGQIQMKEWVELGRKHKLPTFNDAAADVPPLENLTRPIALGFDLIAVSGGKAIRGPQSAGLLLGRADLIRAARLNTVPFSDTMGRSCKVNKEELVGMMVALEQFLKRDHAADYRAWERSIETIDKAIRTLPGVTTEKFVPKIANACPHLRIGLTRLTPEQLMQQLRDGEPSIELVPGAEKKGTVEVASWTLEKGEPEIVAARLRALLSV